jgi:hypothetical protein
MHVIEAGGQIEQVVGMGRVSGVGVEIGELCFRPAALPGVKIAWCKGLCWQ